jgi:hypothetical protein
MGFFTNLVTGMVAAEALKQPSVYSEDPNVEILSVHRKFTKWEVTYKYKDNKRHGIQKQKFSRNTTSISTGDFKISFS